MVRPRCANASTGCGGEANSRRKTNPELCGKCVKTGQGKIFVCVSGVKRWATTCANANTALGILCKCRGHLHKSEEQRKICGPCSMRQTDVQRKWALDKKGQRQRKMEKDSKVTEVQKRNKMEKDSKVTDLTKLEKRKKFTCMC